MAQDLRAVNPHPVECRVRENVDIIPIHAGKSPYTGNPPFNKKGQKDMHPPA